MTSSSCNDSSTIAATFGVSSVIIDNTMCLKRVPIRRGPRLYYLTDLSVTIRLPVFHYCDDVDNTCEIRHQ